MQFENAMNHSHRMNQTRNNYSDIRIQHDNDGTIQWVPAPPDFAAAYMHYKNRPAYSPESPLQL